MSITNCCGAEFYEETDICTACKEHASPVVYVTTDRGEEFDLEEDETIIRCRACDTAQVVDTFDKYTICTGCQSELFIASEPEVDYEEE